MKMHWHCFQRVQSLFVFAFGSLITSFYTEKKFHFHGNIHVIRMFSRAWKNSFLHFVFLEVLHWFSSEGYHNVCLVFFPDAATKYL